MNCGFGSINVFYVVIVYGIVKFMQCIISDSLVGGIEVEGCLVLVLLIKCKVKGNGKKLGEFFGIDVIVGGCVDVKECFIYGNIEGVCIFLFVWNKGGLFKEVMVESYVFFINI